MKQYVSALLAKAINRSRCHGFTTRNCTNTVNSVHFPGYSFASHCCSQEGRIDTELNAASGPRHPGARLGDAK